MAIKPVELSKAYRLLQLGPTTMLSAKHEGDADVMAAAWVGLGGPNKVIAYIGTQAYTRKLVEKSGYFVVHIPTAQQMETVLYVGEHSKNTMPNKLDSLPLFCQEGVDAPMVEGSAGWLVCKVIPTSIRNGTLTPLWEKSSPRGAMIAYSMADTGFLTMRQMSCAPCIMSLAGSSIRLARAPNLTTGRG